MSYRRHYLMICICFLTLNACATLKEMVKEPTVTFRNVTAQDLSLTQGTFLFNFDVENPNALGLTLNDITYDLRLNQKDFIKNKLEKGVSLPAKGNAVMQIPVTVRYTDLFHSLSDALASDVVHYDLKGTVGIGPLTVAYRHEGKIDMPKRPDISLVKISVSKLSFSGAALTAKLKLKNPNDFDIDFSAVDYAIKLGGKELAQGLAKNSVPLTAKGESLMDLDIKVDFKEIGRSGMLLLKGGPTAYELSGNFLLNQPGQSEKRIPFSKTGDIPLK